ncbi:cache domain-containing sensor histidine kinase [Paenibacillus sp. UNC451MF]|uniref:cache domain-containing sensor histidine kinase n=1 Tax=Paenibacillus sp. UNC451MF TaxID=1449063 RepID=UPI0007E8D76F|nr:sensor histidine kinase [Paenibacillus sp. UNC451MF]
MSMTLRKKIVLIFILLITIPLVAQGIITYIDFSSSVERKTVNYTVQILSQINRSMDQTLKEQMQNISLLPLYNTEVRDIIDKYSDLQLSSTTPTLEERSQMFHAIAGTTSYYSEIRGVQIISNNGSVFSSMDPYLVRPSIRWDHEPWYARVQQGNGEWVLIPQHRPDYLLEDSKSGPYIAAARIIREPGSRQIKGLMKIDFRLDVFQNISESYRFAQIGNLMVLNENNELFYEQNNEHLSEQTKALLLQSSLPNENGIASSKIPGASFLTIVDRSSFSGLKMVSFIPVSSLHQETEQFRRFTLLTLIVCLAAACGAAIWFSYKLSRPLMEMKEKMHLVEQGKLKQQMPIHSQDEIGQLSSGFNRMSEEIDRLVNEVYAIRLKEKEAQLSALLTQMNPHFLYNTLESINMMAIRREAYEISDMVSSLGQLLRHSVGTYSRLVLLEDEIASIASYVSIQQLRYGDHLHVAFQIDEALLSLYVPKLVLQPLVENAIYHGIDGIDRPGSIWISAARFEDELLLTVTDNGKGLNEEEIDTLQQKISTPGLEEESTNGLALRNMNQRLVLMFGKQYGLLIDGSPGQGVSITVTIPVIVRSEDFVQSTASGG